MKDTPEEIVEDIRYLFSRINWKTSFIDAKAAQIMNSLQERITELESNLKEVIIKDLGLEPPVLCYQVERNHVDSVPYILTKDDLANTLESEFQKHDDEIIISKRFLTQKMIDNLKNSQ